MARQVRTTPLALTRERKFCAYRFAFATFHGGLLFYLSENKVNILFFQDVLGVKMLLNPLTEPALKRKYYHMNQRVKIILKVLASFRDIAL